MKRQATPAMHLTTGWPVCVLTACVFLLGAATANDEPSAPPRKGSTTTQDNDNQDQNSKETRLAKFMQKKLKASSEILRGLMVEDFELIEKNADVLLTMSKAEQWRASNDMMYLQRSRQFRSTVEDLKQKASRRSMDGASLAWVNTTMSCIQCHEWVRNYMVADQQTLPSRQQQLIQRQQAKPAAARSAAATGNQTQPQSE